MRTHRLARMVLALALAAAARAAPAQDAAPTLQEDPRAARFSEVERGFFVGLEAGFLGLGKTPVADKDKYAYAGNGGGAATGIVAGVNMGVDIGSRLALSAFLQSGNEHASVNYGAFQLTVFGADLRANVLGARDRNGAERFYLYLHARGAVGRTSPTGLFGDRETYLAGGPGIEYYTHLRHFSVGLAADGVYAMKAKSAGFAVYPTVRYTF